MVQTLFSAAVWTSNNFRMVGRICWKSRSNVYVKSCTTFCDFLQYLLLLYATFRDFSTTFLRLPTTFLRLSATFLRLSATFLQISCEQNHDQGRNRKIFHKNLFSSFNFQTCFQIFVEKKLKKKILFKNKKVLKKSRKQKKFFEFFKFKKKNFNSRAWRNWKFFQLFLF